MKALTAFSGEYPAPYWANTSSNHIVRTLVERADLSVREELEELLAGGTITKAVHEEITYDSVYDSEDHLWNFLFFTGYLKQISRKMEQETQYMTLAIPNLEVKYIYKNTIIKWFREAVRSKDLSAMYQAMLEGRAEELQAELSKLLRESISYMDSQEAFYHGFLMGIFANMNDYTVKSNREAGNGRFDILVRSPDIRTAPVIMELKVSETFKGLDAACDAALKQIEEKGYDSWLPEEGYKEAWDFGVAFYKKQCRVKAVRRTFQ